MDHLEQLISGVSPSNISALLVVCDQINSKMIHTPNFSKDQETPPLLLLCYTARSILHPTLSFKHMRQLLDILAQIEAIRCLAIRIAAEVLERDHAVAQLNGDAKPRLSSESKKSLKAIGGFVKRSDKDRALYRSVAASLCRLHIWTLWTSDTESHRIPIFMRLYFPMLSSKVSRTTPTPLFLHDLSQKERDHLHTSGIGATQFITEANAWEEDRKRYWEVHGLPLDTMYAETEQLSYKTAFRSKFEPPTVEKELVDAIERYVTQVENIYNLLKSLSSAG